MKQSTLAGGTKEDFEKGKKMFEMLAMMFSRSIIGHPMWKDSITEEQKQIIQIERLKQITKSNGEKIEKATDYEAMVYISTVSLAFPLNDMWTKIYMYLFKKFYPDKSEFIKDHEAEIDEYTKSHLTDLKRWLYKHSIP